MLVVFPLQSVIGEQFAEVWELCGFGCRRVRWKAEIGLISTSVWLSGKKYWLTGCFHVNFDEKGFNHF